MWMPLSIEPFIRKVAADLLRAGRYFQAGKIPGIFKFGEPRVIPVISIFHPKQLVAHCFRVSTPEPRVQTEGSPQGTDAPLSAGLKFITGPTSTATGMSK